jgi:putative glutamine amidotransferase
MKPLIGISLCVDGRGRWKPAREYHYIDCAYARAIEEAGGTPIYLPVQRDPPSLLRKVDGLLGPGGDDLPPPDGYPSDVEFDIAPDGQRNFDRRLLSDAMERQLPVLAICYGMQLLATTLGGTLHYDIQTDLPEPPPVNSLHHQGVESPGAGMRVCARAEDGLIEAIERDGAQFCVGVQWHPEKLSGPHRNGLFGAFVAACS